MAELEYQRFIRYPISPQNEGLAVILKVDATAYVESTIWMEETWQEIKSKIGNCTEIYNGRISYNKKNCFLGRDGLSENIKAIPISNKSATGQLASCIPSSIDYTVCLDTDKELNDILKDQNWTQKTLMKEFHAKTFFSEKSKVLERYAFYRGELFTTDDYFSTKNDKEEKCKLYHVCGGLPWQV